MRIFLLDLWMDLREKRLAPVALLLLAAIIAVPIVIAKGTKPAPAAPTPTTASVAPGAPVIQSNSQAGPVESKLQTFSSRDPFEPTGHVASATTGSTTAGGTTGTGTTTTGATTPGTTGGGGTTGTTGTGNTGTGNTGNTTGQQKKVFYTYTVDIRFGPPGNETMSKGVQRLELIPDPQKPQIVFLGVTTTGKTAVFLVDSNLGVDTNGKCKPSADQCTFLYLRPDGDHDTAQLTDQDGNTFRLHLLKIHRILLSAATGTTGNSGSGKTGNSNRSPAFTGKADSKDPNTAPGETPPGEPSQPFVFHGFFADGEGQ